METLSSKTDASSSLWLRVLLKAGSLGLLAGAILLAVSTLGSAAGAVAGCVAAGFYSVGFVRSHVYRESAERMFDARVARHMVSRLMLVSLLGVATFLVSGEPAVKAYLLAFLVGFPVLLISEFPRASKQLKARGIIG
ncbi:MAG: hypothetical protein WD602_10100 [Actinomycetota bacterium]